MVQTSISQVREPIVCASNLDCNTTHTSPDFKKTTPLHTACKSGASGVGSLVNMNTFVPSLIFLMTFCLADSQEPFPIATLPILKWMWLFMGVVSLMASGRQSQFNPCTHLPGASCPS